MIQRNVEHQTEIGLLSQTDVNVKVHVFVEFLIEIGPSIHMIFFSFIRFNQADLILFFSCNSNNRF